MFDPTRRLIEKIAKAIGNRSEGGQEGEREVECPP